jgi:hypothetical protein
MKEADKEFLLVILGCIILFILVIGAFVVLSRVVRMGW